jgi:hypothetical protein
MLHSVILGVVLAGPFLGIDLPRERLMQETRRILLACFPSSNPSSQNVQAPEGDEDETW